MRRTPIKRSRIKPRSKTVKKNRMIKALDAACRQRVVIDRDHDTCIRCSRRNGEWDEEIQAHTQIQWCHVHTREYYVTRWEDDNSFAGCSRCHVFFDNHKVISYEWFRKTFPERWEHLQNILQSRTKAGDLFIRTLYEELKADPPGVTLPISEDFGKEAF